MPPENPAPTPTPTPSTPQPVPPQDPQPTPTPPAAPVTPAAGPTPEQALAAVAKKSMPKIAKIALIAFAVFMVVMAIFIFVVIKFTNNATADAVVVSDQLVNSLQAGDANGVYTLTSETFKNSTSQEETEELVSSVSSALQGEEKVTGKKILSSDGKSYSAIVYTIDNKTYVRVVLEQEGSDWKVLNFRSSSSPLEPVVE